MPYHIYTPSPISFSQPLLNPVQPCTVHGNLIIHLIRLLADPLEMSILCLHLVTHSATQLVETLGGTETSRARTDDEDIDVAAE